MEALHIRVEHESTWVPVISCDDLFQSSRGVFTCKEWKPLEGEEPLKVLVMYASKSKVLFGRAVP